jgi:exodeoxyribonuclease III
MKIATFNINNVNRRLPNLLDWLKTAKPDIVCLQELKCTDAQFPVDAIKQAGYHAVWRGQRTWNGVAILSRGSAPIVTRTSLPATLRTTSRAISRPRSRGYLLAVSTCRTATPSQGPSSTTSGPGSNASLRMHVNCCAKIYPSCSRGDYNVAPTEIDIYPTSSWDDDALVQPQSRAAYAKLVAQGWTDAIRSLHPDERINTFWHYLRHRWERNAGLRLDHLLLSPAIASRLPCCAPSRGIRAWSWRRRSRPTGGRCCWD